MDDEPRNTRADIVKSRHCATGLFKAAKVTTIPIVVNDLVSAAKTEFDITVAPVSDKMFSGKGDAITQKRNDSIFIIYNDERPTVRKRFSVAHELGHLYLGHLHGNSSNDLDTDNFDEIEANAFAAHLLIPPNFLRKDIKNGMKDPEDLARRYGVSVEAMWFQIRNSGLVNVLSK